MYTDFDKRMKGYEKRDAIIYDGGVVMARLDGRAFHTFTRGLKRPFDDRFNKIMKDTAAYLMTEGNPIWAYVQSDEITLVWEENVFFNGKANKMISILAAMASVYFNEQVKIYIPEKKNTMPVFDCRVWQAPTRTEAVNNLIWRESDARRNAILSIAQAEYGHKSIQKMNLPQLLERLEADGKKVNDSQQWGTHFHWVKKTRRFDDDDLESLPPLHHARQNPDLEIEYRELEVFEFDRILNVANREDVVFDGASPRRLYRTLVRANRAQPPNQLRVVLGAWDHTKEFWVRVPENIYNRYLGNHQDGIYRFHARASLSAEHESELCLQQWEER